MQAAQWPQPQDDKLGYEAVVGWWGKEQEHIATFFVLVTFLSFIGMLQTGRPVLWNFKGFRVLITFQSKFMTQNTVFPHFQIEKVSMRCQDQFLNLVDQ